jgi:hypothetical protein
MAAVVSLKKVVDEIDMLFNDAWTAYLNRRTWETYTVTEEGAAAVDEPDGPDAEDWQRAPTNPNARRSLRPQAARAVPDRSVGGNRRMARGASLAHTGTGRETPSSIRRAP